jgi:hypothetical protein
MPTPKLIPVEVAPHYAWYRTQDGAYDVLGEDLNARPPVGQVWSWRPARPTREWSTEERSFSSKTACLSDLVYKTGVQ